MTKEMLKGLIELVSEEDIETLYNVVVKFIPENVPPVSYTHLDVYKRQQQNRVERA